MNDTLTKTILIAEDDEGIIEVMRIILEQEGYRVVSANSKNAIQNTLAKTVPDLMFLDIRLGGDSGEEIGDAIRSRDRTKHVPLIILSADSEAENITKKIGASGFLLKPFDIDSLVKTVKKHIR
jgi:DNA-binding response OmpR family regulator